jgi:hypothetical protein
MKSTFELPRTKQCSGCPWRKSIDPASIPYGFNHETHKKLVDHRPAEGVFHVTELHAMACHHSNDMDNMYCIGWLENQLGEGNNIPLRIRMRNCTNLNEIETYGEQRERFEDVKPN